MQTRLETLKKRTTREENAFLKNNAKIYEKYTTAGRIPYSKAFAGEHPKAFSYLVHECHKYAFNLHLLAGIYKSIDKITIRWMEEVYERTQDLQPDYYLVSEEVIHQWRNVFHHILRELPKDLENGNTGIELQLSGIKWAAEPLEWRQNLIDVIQEDVLPEHMHLLRCVEERELLLRELFLNIERSAKLLALDQGKLACTSTADIVASITHTGEQD